MIPTRSSRALGRVSPGATVNDLARLIHRTVDLAVAAKREQGYAAVNIGCDGRKRTTMFDGSACQTSGEVCIATRQDGITACIEAPTQGNGLTMQSVVFAAPVCEPVTGWWIVDADGYMYRVPQTLIDAAPYWPMSETSGAGVTLVRAGTWARLMCGADLTIALNGDGGAQWVNEGEAPGYWTQIFAASMGGVLSQWLSTPTVTVSLASPPLVDVLVENGEWVLSGIVDTDGLSSSFSLDLTDGDLVNLTAGMEYTATVYLGTSGVATLRGSQAPDGTSVAPALPDNALPIAEVVVKYDTTASIYTETADTLDRYSPGWAPTHGAEYTISPSEYRAILLRDDISPNAGSRFAIVTLPSAGAGVVTGAVRVAYGYPFGQRLSTTVPAAVGTWEADCVGRVVGDMAGAYARRLAVEYAEGHICLDGAAITDADDYVSIDEIDRTDGPALDVNAGVVGFPGAEVALLGEDGGDIRTGDRYRVRPAPADPVTVVLEQQAKGLWGDDPNLWIEETNYEVAPWLAAATQFTVVGSGDATFPGRGVPCVLWESETGNYQTAETAYPCTLGETSGGLTTLIFPDGVTVDAATLAFPYVWLTVIGWRAYAAWGWTFTVDGIESALSPLTDEGVNGYRLTPPSTLYSAEITVPAGPTGTTERNVYRYLYSVGPTQADTVGPWGAVIGGLYDRHCRHVKRIVGSGTSPATFYDEDISLTTLGTRPPSPLIYAGPIAIDAPLPVHVLQPMDL